MTKAQRAQQLYDEARNHLRQLAGVSGGRKQWHYTPPNSYANGDQGPQTARPGMFNVQYGVEPSPADIQAYIRSMGGDRSAKKAPGRSAGANSAPSIGGTAPAPGSGDSIQELIAKMAADQKSQQDAANNGPDANIPRYKEVKASNAALYGRVMGEVDNWGNVQRQENVDRARESMGNIRGNLASRGLTDSTIGDAFQARSDKNLAMEQQALSEAKSARRLGYDINLTNDANAFIERRTDRAPDNSALLALSAKLGEAEAYNRGQATAQQRGGRTGSSQQPSYLGPQGVSPAYAGMLAQNLYSNYAGQMNNAAGMLPQYGGGYNTSNRYPTRRGSRQAQGAMNIATPYIPAIGGGIGGAFGAMVPRMFQPGR